MTTDPLQLFDFTVYSAPGEEWQAAAQEVITICHKKLINKVGVRAFKFLKSIGFQDDTIDRFNLGYSTGITIGDKTIPRGIVIPGIVGSVIRYLKIHLPTNIENEKYIFVAGSQPAALFNADDLFGMSQALFCRSEFDVMLSTQEIGDCIPSVTFGSVANRPDLTTWGSYLLPLRLIFSAYCGDPAGRSGTAALKEIAGDRVKKAMVPEGIKDLCDLYKSGKCSLWDWIKPSLNQFDPLSEEDKIQYSAVYQ
jgi:hypothetical protein